MEPTCCSNILDLFLTNNPGQVQAVKILPGLSDHDIVSLQINCKPTIPGQKPRQILLFSKANYEDISNIDISKININTLWTHFHDTLIDLTAKYIPQEKM